MQETEAETATIDRPPLPLAKFAFQVAGPREFLIAGTINGIIAWWLFGSVEVVRLVGGFSVMSMWIPLSFFLPTLSSFFGVLAGALSRKAGAVTPPLASDVIWLPFAIRVGLIRGLISLVTTGSIAYLLASQDVSWAWSGMTVVTAISILSGLFAFVMHSTATLATRSIGK